MLMRAAGIVEDKNNKYKVAPIFLNILQIVSLETDFHMEKIYINEDASKQKFTKVSLNKGNMGQDITIVGDVENIAKMVMEIKNGK